MQLRTEAKTLAFILCITLLTGCASRSEQPYPEQLNWSRDDEVSSAMQALARSMDKLDKVANAIGLVHLQRHTVITELDKMEQLARSMTSETPTRHLLLDSNRDTFLATIAAARQQVQADPPGFYIVGQLTGGCNACHQKNSLSTEPDDKSPE